VGKKEKGRGSLTKRPSPSSEIETRGSTAWSDRPAPVIAGAPGSAAAGGRGKWGGGHGLPSPTLTLVGDAL
jgi:hypothetical protein